MSGNGPVKPVSITWKVYESCNPTGQVLHVFCPHPAAIQQQHLTIARSVKASSGDADKDVGLARLKQKTLAQKPKYRLAW